MGMTIDRLSDKLRTAKESASRTNLLSLGAARARYVGNDPDSDARKSTAAAGDVGQIRNFV